MAESSTAGSATHESRPPDGQRPKVVYVMGSGHSGSTILGVALGNCAGFFYAGELQNFLARAGTPVLGGAARTRFWGVVRDDVPGAEELFGTESQRLLERSLSLFRLHKRSERRALRKRYRPVARDLFHAVARVAEVTHVIDSSHFPLRARELQSLDGLDLYLIFLVRDPQRVVASINRLINRHDVLERRLSILRRNADLWLTHLLSVYVFLRQRKDRRIFVRYEDFIADPRQVLREILDCSDSSAPIPDLGALKTGLPIHANRLIRVETVALKGESAEQARPSRVTALLQRPWEPVLARMTPAAGASGSGGSGVGS
jgi:Sulfotransferase family